MSELFQAIKCPKLRWFGSLTLFFAMVILLNMIKQNRVLRFWRCV